MFKGKDYWKNYMVNWFGEELIKEWEECVTLRKIKSNNLEINLEVFNNDKSAATIILAHGIAGYARVLLPFIIPLFKMGYNIIAPDLQGYGYNDGLKGNFEWNAHKRNLIDTIQYANKNYTGKIFIAGASMGGPLAYATACEEEVDGVIAWCLWDFDDEEFLRKETNTKGFTKVLIPLFRVLSRVLSQFRLKTYALISYDTLTSSQKFNDMVKVDPQAGTHITLKGAASLVLQSKPLVPHEEFRKPVLILQPENDKMTPKYYTQKVSKKFSKNYCKYVEVPECQHFPITKKPYEIWAKEVKEFINRV